jgi:hypothetical protein
VAEDLLAFGDVEAVEHGFAGADQPADRGSQLHFERVSPGITRYPSTSTGATKTSLGSPNPITATLPDIPVPTGNFVVYAPGHEAVWATNTTGQPGSVLRLQDDRNMVIHAPGNVAAWASDGPLEARRAPPHRRRPVPR